MWSFTTYCHSYPQEILGNVKGLHGNAQTWVSERMPSHWDQDGLVLPKGQNSDNLSASESVTWNSEPAATPASFPGGR